jgi:hypothetical protein
MRQPQGKHSDSTKGTRCTQPMAPGARAHRGACGQPVELKPVGRIQSLVIAVGTQRARPVPVLLAVLDHVVIVVVGAAGRQRGTTAHAHTFDSLWGMRGMRTKAAQAGHTVKASEPWREGAGPTTPSHCTIGTAVLTYSKAWSQATTTAVLTVDYLAWFRPVECPSSWATTDAEDERVHDLQAQQRGEIARPTRAVTRPAQHGLSQAHRGIGRSAR